MLSTCGDPAAGLGRLAPERAAQQRVRRFRRGGGVGQIGSRESGACEQRRKARKGAIQAALLGKQRQGRAFESPVRGTKNDCRYVTVLLEDIALFDANGKFDGKDMKLLKGKSIAVLE